ncbi:hypothetical protein AAFF_G00336930 [Aldrovandia affinis]|uniref:Uncharacterized protein n=1 Tax=Aldrovandia affinis TaxID=143900 RepID=A0AAD7WPB1_9TELE|nr:hypothetical protein AAFF_G00336930 [Aldrovandia affinis]
MFNLGLHNVRHLTQCKCPRALWEKRPHPYRNEKWMTSVVDEAMWWAEFDAFKNAIQEVLGNGTMTWVSKHPRPARPESAFPSVELDGWTGEAAYSAVLCQKRGDRYKSVGCYFITLLGTMKVQLRCLTAADCTAWAVEAVEDIVGPQKVIFHTLTAEAVQKHSYQDHPRY